MRRLLAEIADALSWLAPIGGALAWLALIAGLLVAFALPVRPGPRPALGDPDPDPIPGGLASPASDEGRRYEMERAIIELRGRVEALEEWQ